MCTKELHLGKERSKLLLLYRGHNDAIIALLPVCGRGKLQIRRERASCLLVCSQLEGVDDTQDFAARISGEIKEAYSKLRPVVAG